MRSNTFEVRLLHLLPATDTTQPLTCRLEISDPMLAVEGALEYETLSYTWSTESPTEELIVHESTHISITPNLASFLRQRRDADKVVVLWVDAICVNQQDIAERNLQVSFMNLIYTVCTSITVWLGPEDEESDLAVEELHKLANTHPYEKMPVLPTKVCKAIKKLLNRPWWNRVWVAQEICWGGGRHKMWESSSVTVCCGRSSIPWNNLVIACARIKVDEPTLRQTIDGVDGVLHLDYLRWSATKLSQKGRNTGFDETDSLPHVVEYRHFSATDPRDKIYGILGVLPNINRVTWRFAIDYNESVERVYTRFATAMIESSLGLELLRHSIGCSTPLSNIESLQLPSWVPDWSRKRHDTPLPNRDAEVEREIPWWAVPRVTRTSEGTMKISFPKGYNLAKEEMAKAMKGGEVTFDPQEWRRYYPPAMVDSLQEMVDSKRVVFAGIHDEHYIDPRENLGVEEEKDKFARANEIVTQRSFIRTWLDNDKAKRPQYSTGVGRNSNFAIDRDKKILDVEGIIWDKIEKTHVPFPKEMNLSWESSTEFMVAVGQCKQLALDPQHISPYTSQKARHAAFWNALVAGQMLNSVDNFEDYLPVVPDNWTRAEPPLTPRNTRQTELMELQDMFDSRKEELGKVLGKDPSEISMCVEGLPSSILSDQEQQELKTRFQHLGDLWSLQPYDLYHRPFMLPSVVPDPYWESRRKFDKKALEDSSQSRRERWERSIRGENWEVTGKLQEWVHEAIAKEPSIIPQLSYANIDFQLEKYALGRRFFVTRRGYLGIGPTEARKGDSVVVLLGAQVPSILRSRGADEYSVVGETYVSGIMKGEAMTQLSQGKCEARRLRLI